MDAVRIVAPSETVGARWEIRATESGPGLSTYQRKVDAVAAAREELGRRPGGGTIHVRLANGRTEYRRQVPATAAEPAPAAAPPPTFGAAFQQVRNEKKQADQAINIFLGNVWPWVILLAGPAANVLFSPDVAEQRSLFGVFFATLAWSLGVAAAVALLQILSPLGFPQMGLILTISLGLASVIAAWIGVGFYDVEIRLWEYPGFQAPLAFLEAATLTFGLGGVLLGGISGVVAGLWAVKMYKAIQ